MSAPKVRGRGRSGAATDRARNRADTGHEVADGKRAGPERQRPAFPSSAMLDQSTEAERMKIRRHGQQMLRRLLPYEVWIETVGRETLADVERVFGSTKAFYDRFKSSIQAIADGTDQCQTVFTSRVTVGRP